MTRTPSPVLILLLALSPLLLSPQAHASPRQLPGGFSPWLLPEGDLTLRLQVSILGARSRYDSKGHLKTLPLDERISSHDYGIELRWGVGPELELAAEGFFRYRQRQGDIYPRAAGQCAAPLQVGAPCFDPNGALSGPGDLWLSARRNLLDLPTTLTVAPVLKLPLFYGALPDEGTLYDGLSLGDGQVDLGAWVLAGRGLGDWPALIRMGVGFLHRFGAPGDQLLLEAKVGYVFAPWLIGTLGATGRVSVTPGGAVLAVSPDPETGHLTGVEQSASQDWGVMEAGVIVKTGEGTELTLSGEGTVSGRDTDAYRGANLTVTFFF